MQQHARLGMISLGVAFGTTWAIALIFLGLTAMWWHWGEPVVRLLGSLYWGYAPTFGGSLIGGLWGFCDWFIGGVVIAWIYNRVCTHCCKGEHCCPKE